MKKIFIYVVAFVILGAVFFNKTHLDLQYVINYFSSNAPNFGYSVLRPIQNAFSFPDLGTDIFTAVKRFFSWVGDVATAPMGLINYVAQWIMLFINFLF